MQQQQMPAVSRPSPHALDTAASNYDHVIGTLGVLAASKYSGTGTLRQFPFTAFPRTAPTVIEGYHCSCVC